METIYEIVRIKQVLQEIDFSSIKQITSPNSAIDIATHFIGDEDREVFLVMCLNTKNQVVAVHRCHVGSLNASLVNTREVFKACILNNSNSMICAHNHPSQNVTPSSEDDRVTQKLKEAGQLLDIELLDHLVINSKGEFYSYRENGKI